MKKRWLLILCLMLALSLIACKTGETEAVRQTAEAPQSTPSPAPAAEPTAEPAPERLSAHYAQLLQSGTYTYTLTVETSSATQTVIAAAKNGMYYISTGVPSDSISMLTRDGKGYAVRQLTGEIKSFDPAMQGQYIPVYETLDFKESSEADGKTTETYSCKTEDGGEGEVRFVFENGTLTEMSTPELTIEGTWPVTDFNAEPSDALFEIPAAAEGPVSPYAWLGYAELPQNNYFDIMATGCYYREYDTYALGLIVHQIQASDITNQYAFDGGNNITLILNGMQMRLYGITFILAGIIMLVITVVQWLKLRSFRDCEVTTATVTGVDSSKHYANNRQRTSYSMRVSYNVDGNAYERNLACDAEEYKLGANRQVEIRYKSQNPKKILLNAGEKQARGQKILWIITLALFVIGAVLILLAK